MTRIEPGTRDTQTIRYQQDAHYNYISGLIRAGPVTGFCKPGEGHDILKKAGLAEFIKADSVLLKHNKYFCRGW